MKNKPETAQFTIIPAGLIEPTFQTAEVYVGQSAFAVARGNQNFTGAGRLAYPANWKIG